MTFETGHSGIQSICSTPAFYTYSRQKQWPFLRSESDILTLQSKYVTLHYITLHYIVCYFTIAVRHVTLHYITLYCIALYYISLPHVTLHDITWHYITFYFIVLHCITVYFIILPRYYIQVFINTRRSRLLYICKFGFCCGRSLQTRRPFTSPYRE